MFAMAVMRILLCGDEATGPDITGKPFPRQRGRTIAPTTAGGHDTDMIATVAELQDSLSAAEPPAGLDTAVKALWHAAKGDWNTAHTLAQSCEDASGAWVHAYLHRVEGDESNAGYWYRRAGKPHATVPLEQEWREIAAALLTSR